MFEQLSKIATEATNTLTDAINDNNVSERFTTASDQVLDAVLDANRRIVDAAVTTVDRVGEQMKVELPFADRLPTPAVAGERYLDFVERAVSLNRDMNQRVAEMIKADNARAASDKVVATAKQVADTAKNVTDTATKTVADTAKSVAKQTPATKKATAKKATARKATARKATARKATARKATAKKAPAKKAVAKRPAKQTAAKKAAASK